MANENKPRRAIKIPAGFLYRYIEPIYFFAIIIITAIVYRVTLCPTVEYIDSGELALACKYLGIAHPTGYPLYTLLGRLAAILLWGDLIHRVNLLSLIFTSLASGFLFLAILRFLTIINEKNRLKSPVSISATLFVSLSPIWWAQGTTNEVYSLNLLLLVISIWGLFKFIEDRKNKWLVISSYLLGLSLTNHLSAIYMVPAYIFIIFYLRKKGIIKNKPILISTCLFVFPLTIYLFLPIRARFAPFLNWGGVDDLYFLYKHITGWQYRIWMFTDFSLGGFLDKIGASATLVYRQIGWIGFVLGIVGIIRTYAKKAYLALFGVSIIVLNFIYASNYEIIDIESYYLPMIMASGLFIGSGLVYIANVILGISKDRKAVRIAIMAGIILLPVSGFFDNFFVSDRSRSVFARQSVIDLADSMEPGGLALVENWDFYSPWLYFHFEDGFRPDMILLDKELMRRSWYIGFLKREFPEIYRNSKGAIEEFLREVEPFERSRPFDPERIDRAYYNMLHTIVLQESARRPVYTNIITDKKFLGPLDRIPTGTLFKITDSKAFIETGRFVFEKSLWGNRLIYRDKRIAMILSYYKSAFSAREQYCKYFGRDDEAAYYAKMTAEVSTVIAGIINRN